MFTLVLSAAAGKRPAVPARSPSVERAIDVEARKWSSSFTEGSRDEKSAALSRTLALLELVVSAPVEVELIDARGPSQAPEVKELERRLPPWTALDTGEIWSVKKRI